jgi:hypothetical protein
MIVRGQEVSRGVMPFEIIDVDVDGVRVHVCRNWQQYAMGLAWRIRHGRRSDVGFLASLAGANEGDSKVNDADLLALGLVSLVCSSRQEQDLRDANPADSPVETAGVYRSMSAMCVLAIGSAVRDGGEARREKMLKATHRIMGQAIQQESIDDLLADIAAIIDIEIVRDAGGTDPQWPPMALQDNPASEDQDTSETLEGLNAKIGELVDRLRRSH